MAAKHRPNPRTRETHHRVYRMPEALRGAVRKTRLKRGQTAQEFIRLAVEDELPRLVATLKAVGIVPAGDDCRPAKLPLDERLLKSLKKASDDTALSQSQLLLSCLKTSAVRKRRRPSRKK